MSGKRKLIADIRFFEKSERVKSKSVVPRSLGALYPLPNKSFHLVGDRLALMLRHEEFKLPGFDHLYVLCSPDLADHAVAMLNSAFNRIRFVGVGLSISRWESLNDDAKHDELVDLAIHAAEHFSRDPVLQIVGAELKAFRSEVEIPIKAKDTATYRVEVSIQIRPRQARSVAFVSFLDKRSGQSTSALLGDLLDARDIFPLCGSISVRKRVITIQPRPSFQASLTANHYEVPVLVPVDCLVHGTEIRPFLRWTKPSVRRAK